MKFKDGRDVINTMSKQLRVRKNNETTIDLGNKEPDAHQWLKNNGFSRTPKKGTYTNADRSIFVDINGMSGYLSVRENTKSKLRALIERIIREEFRRVTHGEEEIHKLNDEPLSSFISKYKGSSKDIFFKEDGTAAVTSRSSNLIFHGKDGGKSLKLNGVKYVYSGITNEWYDPSDFGSVLKSAYYGRNTRIRAIHPPTK